jgi:polar amino acid transport system substrate-binding protein
MKIIEMKRRIFFMVWMVVLTSFFSSAGLSQGLEKMPVLTLNDSNKAPFTTKNGDGFLDLVLLEVFRRIGYTLHMVRLPPERGLLSANQGIVDGDVNRIAGLDSLYLNLLPVPEKIRNSEFCALSKSAGLVNRVDELNNWVVGHIKGWKIYDKMMAGSDKVITANSPQQLFRLLDMGRIDVALYSCAEGLDMARQLGVKGIKILKPAFKQRALFLYLNKRHAALLPKISKALIEIKREGLYARLYDEKIAPYYENMQDSR